jgi:hypothetical protein
MVLPDVRERERESARVHILRHCCDGKDVDAMEREREREREKEEGERAWLEKDPKDALLKSANVNLWLRSCLGTGMQKFLRRCAKREYVISFKNFLGVDAMITIFCNVRQFSAEKLAFFTRTNVVIKFLHNLALY